MKILFATLMLPQPHADHASSFTVFKVIEHLSERHDVSLISFVVSEEERRAARFVAQYCRRVETVLLPRNALHKLWVRANLSTLTPIAISQAYSSEMRKKIRSVQNDEKFDLVELEYTPMAQYLTDVADSATVLAVQDVMYVVADRFAKNLPFSRKKLEWLIDGRLCRRYEPRQLARFDRVITVSRESREQLLACNPDLDISVVSPGVDPPAIPKTHSPGRGSSLIFMGAMWRPHNVDAVLYFYHSIFGRIRQAIPDVTLCVVGGSPSEKVRGLESDPSVRVTGYVKDLLPFYLESDVSVVPMRIAGGIMCKVLDAMAAGLPVVTTSQGNEGVGAGPEEEIIVADSPEEFARRTVELLEDGGRRQSLSERGLEFVRLNHGWDQIIHRLESVYEDCLSSR
jgi:glycosyltransferase involved in cell wall biosynthesis